MRSKIIGDEKTTTRDGETKSVESRAEDIKIQEIHIKLSLDNVDTPNVFN